MTAALPPAIVDVLMHDREIRECVAGTGTPSAGEYLAKGFRQSAVTLSGGERMTVLVGNAACLSRGASARVFIFERTGQGHYRRVLDSMSLPDSATVDWDGTAVLPTHETMDVLLESVYVWNGTAYVFSPSRSTVYDVGIQKRAPYETPVSFVAATGSATLSGIVSLNFSRRYTFAGRKGQRVTVETVAHAGRIPAFSIWRGGRVVGESSQGFWTGTLGESGTYVLDVYGGRDASEERADAFTVRLSIRPG